MKDNECKYRKSGHCDDSDEDLTAALPRQLHRRIVKYVLYGISIRPAQKKSTKKQIFNQKALYLSEKLGS
jgi:hypothetical protein